MLISTQIEHPAHLVGEARAIELVAQAGYDAWDFSMFEMARYDWSTRSVIDSGNPLSGPGYAKFARELRKVSDDCGLHCNQSHAPFPVCCETTRGYLKRAIECTAIAGGKICVIHPDNDKTAEENAEMYLELLPFAKSHGVKIATENMWNWDNENDQACPAACSHHLDFLAHIQAVNDPYLVACLDIGHSEMKGLSTSAEEMIRTLGPHLQALHIHDNDRWHDSHLLPFTADIDFTKVVKALKEIGYSGYFTLEADHWLFGTTAEELPDKMKKMAQTARRLADMFENA